MESLLTNQGVFVGLEATDKKSVLLEMARQAASLVGQTEHAIFDVLWERECLATTGIGRGIAIPHGRLEGMDQVQGLFARLAHPVAFDAVDDQPVDLVMMLLAPSHAGADHLKALSWASHLMRDSRLCQKLRNAKGGTEICRLIRAAGQMLLRSHAQEDEDDMMTTSPRLLRAVG